MQSGKEVLLIGLVVVLMITVPYVYASWASQEDTVFGGFLFNPIDGNSYLAKMRQGYMGSWKFKLPYALEPGEGEFIFLFYIFLGQVGKWLGAQLILVFHLVRIGGSLFMLWALALFWKHTLADEQKRFLAFLISALGSGAGWLGLTWGLFTMDFWVAEAYPFLSAYSSPHFVIGLGLILLLLNRELPLNPAVGLVLSIVLGIIQPFGLAAALTVRTVQDFFFFLSDPTLKINTILTSRRLQVTFLAGFAGLLILAYQYAVIGLHPVLRLWQLQNQTPSPPLWDILVGLSPWVMLALVPLFSGVISKGEKDLFIWAFTAAGLAFIPWDLQRRFLTGIMIPLAGLGAVGLVQISRKLNFRKTAAVILAVLLMLPTNLIILASGIGAAGRNDPQIYLLESDRQALEWLERKKGPASLVLANPRMGLYIPAYTGMRVFYGHPFETPNAAQRQDQIAHIFTGNIGQNYLEDLIINSGVDYILVSGRDPKPVRTKIKQIGRILFSEGQTVIAAPDLEE